MNQQDYSEAYFRVAYTTKIGKVCEERSRERERMGDKMNGRERERERREGRKRKKERERRLKRQ